MISLSTMGWTLYNIIRKNRKHILGLLSRGEIVGKNPFGDASRFFDRSIEDLLIRKLYETGYNGYIVGEELGIKKGAKNEWIFIDPLDGSLNVVRGINFYCVSVAYSTGPTINDIKTAIVWDIPNDIFYIAEKDIGAFKIKDNKVEKLEPKFESDILLFDVGFTSCGKCLDEIKRMGTFRRLGSIIISCMKVAEGIFDGIFEVGKLKATDVAAAYLIMREAGIYVFVEPIDIHENPNVKLIAAKKKEIFEKLMSIYKEYV
ncbi:MAG: inositol monophosphatase family protein [Candidatus Njordarchaeota archaeon]